MYVQYTVVIIIVLIAAVSSRWCTHISVVIDGERREGLASGPCIAGEILGRMFRTTLAHVCMWVVTVALATASCCALPHAVGRNLVPCG